MLALSGQPHGMNYQAPGECKGHGTALEKACFICIFQMQHPQIFVQICRFLRCIKSALPCQWHCRKKRFAGPRPDGAVRALQAA